MEVEFCDNFGRTAFSNRNSSKEHISSFASIVKDENMNVSKTGKSWQNNQSTPRYTKNTALESKKSIYNNDTKEDHNLADLKKPSGGRNYLTPITVLGSRNKRFLDMSKKVPTPKTLEKVTGGENICLTLTSYN